MQRTAIYTKAPCHYRHYHHNGTGSETNRCGEVSNTETDEKTGVATEDTLSVHSIVDIVLMLSVLKAFTAY